MTEQDGSIEAAEESRAVFCQVDLYKQLKEQLLLEADAYRRIGKEQLADVILQSLE